MEEEKTLRKGAHNEKDFNRTVINILDLLICSALGQDLPSWYTGAVNKEPAPVPVPLKTSTDAPMQIYDNAYSMPVLSSYPALMATPVGFTATQV